MRELFYYLYQIRNDDILGDADIIKKKIEELFPERIIDDELAFGTFVMHLPSFTYLYTSDTIKTFGKDFLTERVNHIDDFFKSMHPVDIQVHHQKLHPYLFSILKDIPPEELINWNFSFNYRILNESGAEKTFLGKNMAVLNDNAEVIFIFGKTVEISSFATGFPGCITLRLINELPEGSKEIVKVFTPDDSVILSIREKQILTLIKKGYSSKAIAGELFISVNTVNNHRKNMLKKTGLKNSAELINNSILSGEI